MSTITIKNIGPIKNITLELNKVNVIMGPQSIGKSTIAKIISYCEWVEKRYLLDFEFNYNFKDQFIDFHRVSEEYFSKDSLIDYKSNIIHISYKGLLHKQKIDRISGENYAKSKNIYMPAERNFVFAIPNLGKYKRTNDNIMNFIYDWFEVKRKYTKENVFPILNLGVSYYNVPGIDLDKLILHEKQKELLMENASSGLQSVVPILLLIDYLTLGFHNEKETESFYQKEKYEKEIDEIKKRAKEEESFDVDLKEILISLLEQRKYQFSSFIIEEPEQNLFPKTQRDLVYYMLHKINDKKRDHKLLVTTHSPFILYALNNCMMGYLIKDNMPKKEQKELESNQSWIDPNLVSVWEIDENKGTIKSIKDKKTGTISKNYFNSIMNEVMNEYYEMLNYLEV